MSRNVIIFGSIAGAIIVGMMLHSVSACYANPEHESNDFLGYVLMLIAFSLVFVGIKNQRDRYLNGSITFWQAFKTGLLISAVASGLYVLVWLVDYYVFVPDFLDSYTTHVLYEAKVEGASPAEIEAKATEMAEFAEMYQNPVFVVLISFMEVFPIGLIVSLVSALILRRKSAGGRGELVQVQS